MWWLIGFGVWALLVWFIVLFFQGASDRDCHLDNPSERSEID